MSRGQIGRRELVVAAAAAAVCVSCSSPGASSGDGTGEGEGSGEAIGFASTLNLGPVADVVQGIRDNDGFWYRPEGRLWLTEYPAAALERARNVYSGPELVGMEAGFVALFQKCPHLGCRVPSCISSQWFECPCHGSKYNQVGEKRGGPAPRGMDRFGIEIVDGDAIVNTGDVIQGPAIGTNTTGQEAEGPNCIGEAGA